MNFYERLQRQGQHIWKTPFAKIPQEVEVLTYQNMFGKSGVSDKYKPLNLKNRIIYWNAGNKYLIHLTYVQVNTI